MNDLNEVFHLTSNPCLKGEDQQRFWRRIHRHIQKENPWWNPTASMVWVDLIYQGNDPYTVYLTLPKNVIPHMPHYIKGKEKRKKRRWPYQSVDKKVVQVPSHLCVCEMKLAFDNIFSLPSRELWLPERLPLDGNERARVSFGISPIHKMGSNIRNHHTLHSKMEEGYRKYRSKVDGPSLFKWLLIQLDHLIQRLFAKKEKGEPGEPFLSKETIRKMNESQFKVFIRIAAHQRVIPKLALPMQALKGENELKLQFLPKSEQKLSLSEMNQQKIGFYSMSDLNPNVLGGRELSNLFPFLSNEQRWNHGEITARPNF